MTIARVRIPRMGALDRSMRAWCAVVSRVVNARADAPTLGCRGFGNLRRACQSREDGPKLTRLTRQGGKPGISTGHHNLISDPKGSSPRPQSCDGAFLLRCAVQAIYRKVVRWIYPRYESSAWFRAAFLLATVAVFQASLYGILITFGDGYFVAAAVVAILFAYSWGIACMLTPGQWIERK